MTYPRGTCAGCKHWETISDSWGFGVHVVPFLDDQTYPEEEAELLAVEQQYRRCGAVEMRTEFERGTPLPLAVVQDGSNYKADLFTRGEFGCVLYSEPDA